MSQSLDERVTAIETHLSHQETGLQDISDVLRDQWQTIDRLTKRVQGLERRIENLDEWFKERGSEDPASLD
jgi:uncharacterized coiled-coil protein SlyX